MLDRAEGSNRVTRLQVLFGSEIAYEGMLKTFPREWPKVGDRAASHLINKINTEILLIPGNFTDSWKLESNINSKLYKDLLFIDHQSFLSFSLWLNWFSNDGI